MYGQWWTCFSNEAASYFNRFCVWSRWDTSLEWWSAGLVVIGLFLAGMLVGRLTRRARS